MLFLLVSCSQLAQNNNNVPTAKNAIESTQKEAQNQMLKSRVQSLRHSIQNYAQLIQGAQTRKSHIPKNLPDSTVNSMTSAIDSEIQSYQFSMKNEQRELDRLLSEKLNL